MMLLHRLSLVALMLALPIAVVAGEAGTLRVIDVKGLNIKAPETAFGRPRVIASAAELAKAIPGSEAINKSVDFSKDQLLLFTWSGSGGDKLTAKMILRTVVFYHQGGLTRDFRPHVHLYAIPKGAEYKINGGRGK